MLGAHLLAATTAGLVGLGALEQAWHRRNLKAIKTRVHVNGTRGKSSVTRLIGAGLRQAGVVTCTKTTGSLARMILPSGREVPVFRRGRPNVLEQKNIVALARAVGAEALVLECMALQPALQALCEDKLVRATHAVITNVRPDHLDVMGPDEQGVAEALCGMVPVGGRLFTTEAVWWPTLAAACADRGCALVAVDADAISAVTDAELAAFHYPEHRENVALALQLLADLGVDRATALQGMWTAAPDPGALAEFDVQFFGRRLLFVNGFAANDPVSTRRIWTQMVERHGDCQKKLALFNCRSDRPERSVQLGASLPQWPTPDHVVLMGNGTYVFARAAVAAGLDGSKLVFADRAEVAEIFEVLVQLVDTSALVMGLGNIAGVGLDVVRFFRNRAGVT